MNRLIERIGTKLGHIFDCALVKPLPWQIIDAHEKLREANSTDAGAGSCDDNKEIVGARDSDIPSCTPNSGNSIER